MTRSVRQGRTATRHLLGRAAEHASSNVPVARPGDRVDELLGSLPGNRFDTASVVAVCEDNRLVGLATIERLYAAPADARLSDVMDPNPPVVRPDTNQEHAAWRAVRHAEPGLAVVDAAGRFQGLVIPHRLLGVLLARHDRDVALRGGFLGSAAAARAAATERVGRRLWHRLPWLLIGLAGAAASAVLVLPAVLLGWGDLNIALAVSVALFSAASVATMIAMALPWAIHKMGKDPAYGAGPLATVIQDLVSIAIYLIAVVVLTT